jgi:hypothetical protein
MSVLITDNFSIFNETSKNYRVVIFAKKSKYGSVTRNIEELRNNNAVRLRKGTLRVIENTFDDTSIFPVRFNNYAIELAVTERNGDLTNNVDTIIATLKSMNKHATINIHNWNAVTTRQIRHTCGSAMNAVVAKHGLTSTVQNNIKTIKV